VWSPGQRIGDYELIAKLREGGMATLFLARLVGASGFSRHVAIKVIHPDLADDEQFRQMFLDEALLSSRIQHPNVVHVEELGQHGDAHFLTMEFVHGCSLSQLQRALLSRGRRLAPAFAARIAMHVADGLHAAHETCDDEGRSLNVVHRDVTPENILLAYAGHVKLIDFGIAKALGRRHRTMDGLLKGKFRYMAPEQALGKPVDRRVDIYQLGIVLWEMLTLRRLFLEERDADLLAAVQNPKIVPPSKLVDRIPPALDAAVMAALDPQAKRRPADAQAFARLLGKAVPSAHEVDSGSLRALLLAVMNDQRQHDRKTYPPGVYDRLDKQVETQPLGGSPASGLDPVFLHHTVEHTAPYGSDSANAAAEGPTKGGDAARSQRPARVLRPRPRRRRLVRMASELRTTLTRIVKQSFVGSRAYFLVLGGALGLAGALALITLAVRPRARVLPPLPVVSTELSPAAAQPIHQEPPLEAVRMDLSSVDAPAADAGRSKPASGARNRGRGPARKPVRSEGGTTAGTIIMVDGTPMFSEPGF
jgi:serine/threonine protein kinase